MIYKNGIEMNARYYGSKAITAVCMGGYKQLFRQWLLD